MQQNPLVSIICMCYNHQDFVLESLYSIINQSYKNIEIIIVDDFSKDNSKIIIEKWLLDHPKVQFIGNNKNLGNTKSFNKAAKLAKGDFLIDLASDDVLMPNCVDLQIKSFVNSSYKNLGMVYGNAELINEIGIFDSYYFPVNELKKTIENRKTGNIYMSVISSGNTICSVSAMIKKSVFDQLNGFDENLSYEDLDFWVRVSRNFEIDFIDEILIKKRITKSSLGNDFFKKNNKINYSTYLILKKTIALNKTKQEDLAVLKRVHHEIIHSWENKNIGLFLKNIGLKIKLMIRIEKKSN